MIHEMIVDSCFDNFQVILVIDMKTVQDKQRKQLQSSFYTSYQWAPQFLASFWFRETRNSGEFRDAIVNPVSQI